MFNEALARPIYINELGYKWDLFLLIMDENVSNFEGLDSALGMISDMQNQSHTNSTSCSVLKIPC